MIAIASILPYLDFQTVRIAGYDDLIAYRFEDAWLVGGFAAATAFFARRMLDDPSELAWALLIGAGSLTFVPLAADLGTMGPSGCGNVLGFLNGFLGCLQGDGTTFWLAGQDSALFLWALTTAGAISVLLSLCLPLIEMIERTRFAEED